MAGIDRKPQILSEASELLQSRSFTAFSYHDLSERLGISKASIHHHYATKEELLVALAERFRTRQRERLRSIEEEHESPRARIDAFLDLMSGIARSGTKICPVGALQSEFNVIPERARQVARDLFEVPRGWLTEVLAEGCRRGEWAFDGEPSDRAVLILAAVQGALQIARAHGIGEFDTVVRQIRAGLAPETPGAAERGETKVRRET